MSGPEEPGATPSWFVDGLVSVRHLIFDLDGVLVDSGPAYRAAWRRWSAMYGIDEGEIWQDAHGRRPEDIIRRVGAHLDAGRALAAFDAMLSRENGVCAMPGARGLLERLGNSRWAVVSSGRREQIVGSLAKCNLPEPAVLVSGDELERGKPDPQGFLLGAERLGVPPNNCVVIEDAAVGIAAAQAAGMATVAIASTHPAAELAEADAVFPTLELAEPHLFAMSARRPSATE